MSGELQKEAGRRVMSATVNEQGSEAAAVISRHFTRAGRDPLSLAPFEERLILGRVARVPSSWGSQGLASLVAAMGDHSASEFLVAKAKDHAEAAHAAGLTDDAELMVHIDELAWVLGRGMGWVGEESGIWIGTVNLHHFCEPVTQRFDLAGLRQACRCLHLAAAGQAAKSGNLPTCSLGWTNGAGFLLVAGIAYDSSRGVGILGSIAAMILGQSCLTLAHLAGKQPALALPEAQQIVLAGLNHAKSKASELPPTSSVASPSDSDRWLSQTCELLDEALVAVQQNGVVSPFPTAPQPCRANEEWLDPISTLAEAVPTFQVPDLGAKPEVRSCLKAMGLTEAQRTSVLEALTKGESILAAGVPESKAPSLKTALGSWSFHPNAQLMMGSAVAPFLAGPLKHRIHLPAGIPEEFTASVLGAASRFGLSGVEVCLASREPAPAQENLPEADTGEEPLGTELPQPEAPLEVPEELVGMASLEQEEATEPAVTPLDQPPAKPDEAQPENEVQAPPPLTEERTDEAEASHPDRQTAADQVPEPGAQEATAALEPAVTDDAPAALETESPGGADLPGASDPDGTTTSGHEEPEAPSEASLEDEVLPEAALEPAQSVGIEPVAEDEAHLEEPDKTQRDSAEKEASEASEPALREAPEPEAEEPTPVVLPLAWTRSVKVAAASGSFMLHASKESSNSPLSLGLTASGLPQAQRTLLEAVVDAMNVGFARGATVEDYRGALKQPTIVREFVQALAEAIRQA